MQTKTQMIEALNKQIENASQQIAFYGKRNMKKEQSDWIEQWSALTNYYNEIMK